MGVPVTATVIVWTVNLRFASVTFRVTVAGPFELKVTVYVVPLPVDGVPALFHVIVYGVVPPVGDAVQVSG